MEAIIPSQRPSVLPGCPFSVAICVTQVWGPPVIIRLVRLSSVSDYLLVAIRLLLAVSSQRQCANMWNGQSSQVRATVEAIDLDAFRLGQLKHGS